VEGIVSVKISWCPKDSLFSHLKEMGEISLFSRVLENPQASLKVE
jgi:hypothetical protein